MPIREIVGHLERGDARIERNERLEILREHQAAREKRIKLIVGIIAILCALYTIAAQF